MDRGTTTVGNRRTSLIIDPPNGRIPAVTDAGRARSIRVGSFNVDVPASYTDLSNADRCIMGFNAGPPITPGGYNQNVQIFQTPDHLVLLTEMVHTVRVIPLDGRQPLDADVHLWSGDSRGHWEGDTLVVDVTGLSDQTWFDRAGSHHSYQLHVVERYTMVSPNHIDYEATIEDPLVLTEPFTIKMPLYRRLEDNARLMDFRCVEFVEELMFGEWRRNPLPR